MHCCCLCRLARVRCCWWRGPFRNSTDPRSAMHAALHCPAPPLPAVYAARNGLLYTLNCQCSEEQWADNAPAFRTAADSFAILNSGAATSGFPGQL
jgi:hypothetical protein